MAYGERSKCLWWGWRLISWWKFRLSNIYIVWWRSMVSECWSLEWTAYGVYGWCKEVDGEEVWCSFSIWWRYVVIAEKIGTERAPEWMVSVGYGAHGSIVNSCCCDSLMDVDKEWKCSWGEWGSGQPKTERKQMVWCLFHGMIHGMSCSASGFIGGRVWCAEEW